jgi:hypothetical protein
MAYDRQLSAGLLASAKNSFRNLDLISAFDFVLESLEADPSNLNAYYQMKTFMSTIAFSYPEKFDTKRVSAILDASTAFKPKSSIVWSIRGLLGKIIGDWNQAEEASFRSALFCDGTEYINNYYLFELGYIYKNIGNLELFNKIAFSAPWQLFLVRKTGRLAIPKEIIDRRLVKINLKFPPVKYIKQFEQNPGRLHLLQIDKNFEPSELARFIGAIEKRNVEFAFYNKINDDKLRSLRQLTGKEPEFFIRHPGNCPAAAIIKDYSFVVCPLIAEEITHILERIGKPWQVSIESDSFCPCRNKPVN